MEDVQIILTETQVQALLGYLVTRPFNEVADGVAWLSAAEEVEVGDDAGDGEATLTIAMGAAQGLLQYLAARPYSEVYEGVGWLQTALGAVETQQPEEVA